MRRRVWSRNLKNEEAMARVGSQRQKKKHFIVKPFNRLILKDLRQKSCLKRWIYIKHIIKNTTKNVRYCW